jgi:hypothetical protein
MSLEVAGAGSCWSMDLEMVCCWTESLVVG